MSEMTETETARRTSSATVVGQFLDAYGRVDLPALRALLADDLLAFVTGPDATAVRVEGADYFLGALASLHLEDADFSVSLTQEPVAVDDTTSLIMVEIRAQRDQRTLHNFAAHLIVTANGKITRLHMVDAKPAESDAFWS